MIKNQLFAAGMSVIHRCGLRIPLGVALEGMRTVTADYSSFLIFRTGGWTWAFDSYDYVKDTLARARG